MRPSVGVQKGKGRTRPALVGPTAAAAAEATIALATAAAAVAAAAEAAAADEAAALRLGGAAGHLLRTLLALALVERLHELDLGALDEALAVLDAREVAEEVLATVVRLDEAEALLVPALGNTSRAATAAATAASAAPTVTTAIAAAVAATATAGGAAAAAALPATTTTTKVSTVAHLVLKVVGPRKRRWRKNGGR